MSATRLLCVLFCLALASVLIGCEKTEDVSDGGPSTTAGPTVATASSTPVPAQPAGDAATDVPTPAPTASPAPATQPSTEAPPVPTAPPPPPPTAPPAPTAPPPTQAPRANCDASYPDFCIPPPPPDLDCPDIGRHNFTVLPPDPHRFDGDHDGVGCEN